MHPTFNCTTVAYRYSSQIEWEKEMEKEMEQRKVKKGGYNLTLMFSLSPTTLIFLKIIDYKLNSLRVKA